MAARTTFAGAITVAGFPFAIRAYSITKGTRNESFKTLCDCHDQPIAQRNHCRTTDAVVTDPRKGVEIAKDQYRALPQATIDLVTASADGAKTRVLEPFGFPLLASVPLHLSLGGYRVQADPKAAGSAGPVATLWRVLRKTGRAIDTSWVTRSGSPDTRLVIYADDEGLLATALPWAVELNAIPASDEPNVTVPDAQVAMFEQAITTMYDTGDFALDAQTSAYKQRREEAIERALAGQPQPEPAAPVVEAAPDLMAALQASLAAARQGDPVAA